MTRHPVTTLRSLLRILDGVRATCDRADVAGVAGRFEHARALGERALSEFDTDYGIAGAWLRERDELNEEARDLRDELRRRDVTIAGLEARIEALAVQLADARADRRRALEMGMDRIQEKR